MARTERLVFEWQRSRSEASHRGWEMRWERGEAVGPKGKAYLEREYGPVEILPERGGGGGGGGDFEDYDDYWDWEGEEDSP